MLITFYELANLEPFLERGNLTLGGVDYEFSLVHDPKLTLFNIEFRSPRGAKVIITTQMHAKAKIFISEQFEVSLERGDGQKEAVYRGRNTEEIIGPNTQAAVEKALSDLIAEGQKITIGEDTPDRGHLLDLDSQV
jgi:hypothetical protein